MVAKNYSDNGFEVVSFDLRGHGKSLGKAVYFPDLDTVLNDISAFIQLVEDLYKDLKVPRFILGYSLGGLLAYTVQLKGLFKFDAFVMMAPGIYYDVAS